MHQPITSSAAAALTRLDPEAAAYASDFVDALLGAALASRASDVHLQPAEDALCVLFRIDGVLHEVGRFPITSRSSVVVRLKVLADLLTYRSDIPQEGRLRHGPLDTEMRVSTFPTLHGERAVVRLFASSGRLETLADLGLPDEIRTRLCQWLSETSGAILVTGPAGSGKTTTLYACLREIAAGAAGRRSIVTLEDPIESVVPGVAQSPIQPAAGFDFATGLRSLMRQDPEVIMVGEIRDRITAEVAFQASLTGQLVLSSFHAPSAAGALSRLAEMGIERYLVRSGLLAVVSQRLLRRLCQCAKASDDPADRLGLQVGRACQPVGCAECDGRGYRGRFVIAEMLPVEGDVGRAILADCDRERLEQLAADAGMVTLWRRAEMSVEAGRTSPAEVRRVLGSGHTTGMNQHLE
ncbi:MAG: GspE/PulE family protein [Planctomycetia bacterium]|nr:GspE/PulE family protein [Planctomycetia bacterium]